MSTPLTLSQIALATSDRARSAAFYRDVFHLNYIFETSEFRGPSADKMQSMDRVASSTCWLMDDRDGFQLELFEFEYPLSRPLPEDHGIVDEGYNRLLIIVQSLQEVVSVAVGQGAHLLSQLERQSGLAEQHAILTDPDGIVLELIEAPALLPDQCRARIIGLGLTTLDLTTAVQDFCHGFGFQTCEDRFEHGVIWNSAGTLMGLQTLRLGDMYLVVSQYEDGRPRRSDHCLADIGVMNFAVSFSSAEIFDAYFASTLRLGMRPNTQPMRVEGKASVVYHNTLQHYSVEMLYMDSSLAGLYGFRYPSLKDRLVSKLVNWRSRWVYRRHLAHSKNH